MSKNDIPCQECGELEDHNLHHDVANPMTSADVHFDECDYSASYKGAIQGWFHQCCATSTNVAATAASEAGVRCVSIKQLTMQITCVT